MLARSSLFFAPLLLATACGEPPHREAHGPTVSAEDDVAACVRESETLAVEPRGAPGRCPLKNFHRVSPAILRGARPDSRGMAVLAALGVETVINLEDYTSTRRESVVEEARLAREHGMRHVWHPISPVFKLDEPYVRELVDRMGLTPWQPVYVHCLFGLERTGFLIGLHRVFNEGWCGPDAWDEMKRYGFRQYLTPMLKRAFFSWTASACDGNGAFRDQT
jgi:protein tyrosine/serine phosphatase